MMNALYLATAVGLSVGLVNIAWADDHTGDCFDTHADNIQECTNEFGPTGNFPDPNSQLACTQSANAGLNACLDGTGEGHLNDAWDAYIQRLIACSEIEDPIQRAGCVSGATITYRWEVNNPPNPDDDDCDGELLPASTSPIESLTTANGFLTLAGDSGISITAGVSTAVGSEYDVRDKACLKNALLIAIYQTKDGGVARVVDADTDLTDGASFDYFVDAPSLIDATDVTFVVLYRNQSSLPEFAEFAMMKIEDSPISGDWNRDQVKDAFDVIDYLDGFDAQTQRSDISNDGVFDSQDISEFVSEFVGD